MINRSAAGLEEDDQLSARRAPIVGVEAEGADGMHDPDQIRDDLHQTPEQQRNER